MATSCRSLSQLEQDVQVLRFSIQTLALRTPHCGPGQSASDTSRATYIQGQEQLDALIIEYDHALKDLWQARERQQSQPQRRMMTS